MSHCVSCLSQEAYELFREWLDLTCWNIKFFEGKPIENIGRAPLVNQDSAHYKVRNLQFDYHGIIVRWIRNAPDVFEMRFLECQTQPFLSDRIPGANRAWRTKKPVLTPHFPYSHPVSHLLCPLPLPRYLHRANSATTTLQHPASHSSLTSHTTHQC